MGTVKKFEELDAWQTGRALSNRVYDLTDDDPFASDFGLRDQIRRAAISVMSNIAEGFESRTRSQFIDFLGMAKASAGEVRSQLYVAQDQGYLKEEELNAASDLADKVSRQLYHLIRHLKNREGGSDRVRDLPEEYVVR